MKGFAQKPFAPVLVALVAIAVVSLAALALGVWFVMRTVIPTFVAVANHPTKILTLLSNGQTIHVAIFSPSGKMDRELPAINGFSESFSQGSGSSLSGLDTHVQVDEQYRVTLLSPGHFQVTVHRSVQKNGDKAVSDLTLPVWPSQPAADKRINLGDGTTAVAYLQTAPH